MKGMNLEHPVDLRLGDCLLTHAAPGDCNRRVQPHDVPGMLEALPDGVTTLISGHIHSPWNVSLKGRRAINPGASGMLEEPPGGIAPFITLDMENGHGEVHLHKVHYDPRLTLQAYLDTGCWKVAPELCRTVWQVLSVGDGPAVLDFMRLTVRAAEENGLPLHSREAWQLADRLYPWPEPVDSMTWWSSL